MTNAAISRTITLPSGISLAVAEQGDGEPVLFVHGFPLDHTQWRFQWEALSARFRVIAPDLRGFGQSPTSLGTVTMEEFADDLAGLLDALEIQQPISLCGLSMGGYIAFQFARKYSERLKGLVLCDTRAVADPAVAAANRLEMAERVMFEGTGFVAEAMLPRVFAPETARDKPELVEEVRAVMLRTLPAGIAAAQRGMAIRSDVTAWLPSLTVPTLVLVGEHDVISPPAEMEAIAALMPRASFVVIPDAGHLAPLENPDDTNAAIERFLSV